MTDTEKLADLKVLEEIAEDLDKEQHRWRANRIREAIAALRRVAEPVDEGRMERLFKEAVNLPNLCGVPVMTPKGVEERWQHFRAALEDTHDD